MSEPLEVVTPDGRPTGIVKPRARIHSDGDWHVASFVWIVARRSNGAPRLVLQRRSLDKDAWPGHWDASCAGHVDAGERPIAAAVRELSEELGITVREDQLVAGPPHRQEHRLASGVVDREHHAVFLLVRDEPLDAYRPGPEVTALAFVDGDALTALHGGQLTSIDADVWAPGERRPTSRVLQGDELVPYDREYLEAIAAQARRLAQVSF